VLPFISPPFNVLEVVGASNVGTVAILTECLIAVVAENPKARRVSLPSEPRLQPSTIYPVFTNRPSVYPASTIDVIKGQELWSSLATARAFTPIGLQCPQTESMLVDSVVASTFFWVFCTILPCDGVETWAAPRSTYLSERPNFATSGADVFHHTHSLRHSTVFVNYSPP